jgi:hypothetical protein
MEKNKYVNLIEDLQIIIIIFFFFLQPSRMTGNSFYSTWFSVNVVKDDHNQMDVEKDHVVKTHLLSIVMESRSYFHVIIINICFHQS